ncbi:hypothetical protein DVA81_18460, partial [Acinetobacter baumannii]
LFQLAGEKYQKIWMYLPTFRGKEGALYASRPGTWERTTNATLGKTHRFDLTIPEDFFSIPSEQRTRFTAIHQG